MPTAATAAAAEGRHPSTARGLLMQQFAAIVIVMSSTSCSTAAGLLLPSCNLRMTLWTIMTTPHDHAS
jgi:hypothetical protein